MSKSWEAIWDKECKVGNLFFLKFRLTFFNISSLNLEDLALFFFDIKERFLRRPMIGNS